MRRFSHSTVKSLFSEREKQDRQMCIEHPPEPDAQLIAQAHFSRSSERRSAVMLFPNLVP